jgi:hypothetical protein
MVSNIMCLMLDVSLMLYIIWNSCLLTVIYDWFDCSILGIADSDVYMHKMCLDTSKLGTTNMEWRDYQCCLT